MSSTLIDDYDGQSVQSGDGQANNDDDDDPTRRGDRGTVSSFTDERTPLLLTQGSSIYYSVIAEGGGGGGLLGDSADQVNDANRSSPVVDRTQTSIENGRKCRNQGHCHKHHSDFSHFDYSACRKLSIASIICLIFMIGEIVGGVLANSLAIATDAAHLLTDLTSFIISLFALVISSWPRTKRMSFGWQRAEMMGALLSVLLIWVVTGVLVYMAILRVITQDYEIDANVMLITAAISVFFNIVMGFLLHDHHGHSHVRLRTSSMKHHSSLHHSNDLVHCQINENLSSAGSSSNHTDRTGALLPPESSPFPINSDHSEVRLREEDQAVTIDTVNASNINVRAAFIHVLGDLVQSIGVLVAAYIIYYKPEWKLADPICTFIFSILVLCTTLRIMKDIVIVLMEGVPHNIPFDEVKQFLSSIKGVKVVHNLHLWSLTLNKVALSAHLAIDDSVSSGEVVTVAGQLMYRQFGIFECTIQTEDYLDEMNDCIHCKNPED